jgi:hypothetical protein
MSFFHSMVLSRLFERTGTFKKQVALGYNVSMTPKWSGVIQWGIEQSTEAQGSKRSVSELSIAYELISTPFNRSSYRCKLVLRLRELSTSYHYRHIGPSIVCFNPVGCDSVTEAPK